MRDPRPPRISPPVLERHRPGAPTPVRRSVPTSLRTRRRREGMRAEIVAQASLLRTRRRRGTERAATAVRLLDTDPRPDGVGVPPPSASSASRPARLPSQRVFRPPPGTTIAAPRARVRSATRRSMPRGRTLESEAHDPAGTTTPATRQEHERTPARPVEAGPRTASPAPEAAVRGPPPSEDRRRRTAPQSARKTNGRPSATSASFGPVASRSETWISSAGSGHRTATWGSS